MSCYLRHLRWLFEVLELEYDKPTRGRVDQAIRASLGLAAEADCPVVWSAVKQLTDAERAALPARVAPRLEALG